jgi:O-antigen/teichoic acid export membrane protein
LLPKVAASSDPDVIVEHTTRVCRLSLWATAAGAAALAIMAIPVIPVVYGEAFRPSIMALLCILPGIVVFSIATVLAAFIAGKGKPHLNLMVSGLSLVVTIALDFLLIPKLNIVGAALASTASYSLSAFMLIGFFKRETGASVRQILLPTGEDVRMLLSLLRFRLSSSEGTV